MMTLKTLKKINTDIICPPKVGELLEGTIINRGKSALFLDLNEKGIGIIYGKEFFDAKEALKELKPGDKVTSKLIGLETAEGYRELSVATAVQELAWEHLITAKESGEAFDIVIKGANKGGLTCLVRSIPAFLPTSQLLPEHYPRVTGGDPSKIATELQKYVGQKFRVKIFDLDQKEKKLILSEKATKKEQAEKELKQYSIGDMVEGEISGVTNFGAFIRFGKDLEGLIHSSEISEKKEETANSLLKVGEKVKAKIIDISNNRVYLSLK